MAFIQPFLPSAAKRGRKLTTDLRDVLDALRYLARTGGGWRMLPNDFPPWQTVYWWFRRFMRRLLFEVKGLANEEATRIVAARCDRPFASADDLWRRAGVKGAARTHLAEAGAFRPGLGRVVS